MGFTPPFLEVRKISGGWNVLAPSSTVTDDLYIYPNTTDTTTKIVLLGNGDIQFWTTATNGLTWVEGATERLRITETTPDLTIESKTDANNIFLKTTGTGMVKFGTFTGSADVACNGSIAVLDALGNARKLMTTA